MDSDGNKWEAEKVSMKQRKAHENEKTAGEKGKFSFHQLFSFGAPERTVLLRNPRKAFFISSRAASCTVLSRIFGFRLESGTGKRRCPSKQASSVRFE